MSKKKVSVTKADYIDRFIARMKLLDRKTFNYDETEDWANASWTQHRNENFRHLEEKSPEKDAEMEWCYVLCPPEV